MEKIRPIPTTQQFARYAWFVLAFNIVIIIWGGFVSASGAGDGCGESWPLCANTVVSSEAETSTLIEASHRISSSLAGLLVLIMLVWAVRRYPKGHRVRIGAFWTFIFILLEGLIGAVLVREGLVADNESIARAFTQPLHLVNTFLLVAWLTLTAVWASGVAAPQFGRDRRLAWLLGIGLLGILIVSVFGAIASLASALYPSQSFIEGVANDFSNDAHIYVRLRIIHPILALAVGGFVIAIGRFIRTRYASARTSRYADALLIIVALQTAAGALNAVLLAPAWLQLTHLFLADLLWIFLIMLGSEALAHPASSSADAAVGKLRTQPASGPQNVTR